ncbi:MAG: hypothetical protein LUF82_07860 [Clostridia bacterium]|nr:hypothetical protein [Clostridia bacterium]
MRTNKHKIAFFAEDGEGTYDELAVDFYNRYYEFKYKTEEKFLYVKGNAVPEIKLCQKDLNKIYDTIKFLYSGEEGPLCLSY